MGDPHTKSIKMEGRVSPEHGSSFGTDELFLSISSAPNHYCTTG